MSSDTTIATPPPPLESNLTTDQPWPGLAPYTEADRNFFHGRRGEIEELMRVIPRDAISLLIGESGVGKTSLVQAGLVPTLAEHDFLPVVVRLDWWSAASAAPTAGEGSAENLANPLVSQLIEALAETARARGVSGPAGVPGDSLWEHFHRAGHRWWSSRQHVVTPVLIIDQFEQAFFAGRETATASRNTDGLIEQISQLVCNRPPPRVTARIEQDSKNDNEYVFDTVPMRILLVMREEQLGELSAYRSLFPTLRRSEMRLDPFSLSRARDCMVRASAQKNLFAEDAVDHVVNFLAQGRVHAVEILPAHLSVLGQALAAERVRRGGEPITPGYLAVRPGRVLHDFALAATSDLPPDAVSLLEEQLVDPAGHPRTMKYSEARARGGIPNEALETMLQRRLLRLEGSPKDPHIALGHGLLVEALKETRIERAFNTREKSAVIASAQAQASAVVASQATKRSHLREAVAWTLVCIFGLVAILAVVLRPPARDRTAHTASAERPTARTTPTVSELNLPPGNPDAPSATNAITQPDPPAAATPSPAPPLPPTTPDPATAKPEPIQEPVPPPAPAPAPIAPAPELQATSPVPPDRAAGGMTADEVLANMEKQKLAERQKQLEQAERRRRAQAEAAAERAREAASRREAAEARERERARRAQPRNNNNEPPPAPDRGESRSKRPVGIGGF